MHYRKGYIVYGSIHGKRVSVMASGMGMPAIGIYSYELFHFYGVENIIRIGTAGALDKRLGLRDLCAGVSCFTNSTFGDQYGCVGKIPPTASYKLLRRVDETAEKLGITLHVGPLLSTDVFYEEKLGPAAARMGAIACEMEAAALYINAMEAGKNALCLCTISDNEREELLPEERQKSLTDMFRLALEIA